MTKANPSPKRFAVFLGDVSEGRENNFDFLRFLLAVFVLFYHCYPLFYGLSARNHGPVETLADLCGGIAVPFFFVLSGFLVTRSWLKDPKLGDFLQKRILRIYPGFLVAALFCAVVVGPLGAADASIYWHQFQPIKFTRWALVLVGPYIPVIFIHLPMSTGVNGSFWTLRYEFYCYLFVAAIGLLRVYRWRVVLAAVFAILFVLREAQTLSGHVFFPNREVHLFGNLNSWSSLIVYFLAGMLFYLYRDNIPFSRTLFFVCLGLLAVCGGFQKIDLVLPVCGSYALLYFAFTRRLRLQHFARFGDFSYGLYLYAFPIQQLLVLYFGRHLNILTLFLSAFALTFCLAVLSWHLVEKLCLRLKCHSSRTDSSRPELTIS